MRGALVISSAVVALTACAEPTPLTGPSTRQPPEMHAVIDGKPVSLSGLGTATIDGVLAPHEWDGAATVGFLVNLPAHDGGGTTPATLSVMNDATNLYLALRIARPSFGGATNPTFQFDNDHDGGIASGDDIIGMIVGIFTPVVFFDAFRLPCPGDPPGTGGCGSDDVNATPPGSINGAAAATNDGAFTTIEMVHPLNGPDHAHDFSLVAGQTVGFSLFLRLFALDPACNAAPDCYRDTSLPLGGFGDIVVGLPVGIDVRPGSTTNPINLGALGVVPVAILGSASFDPRTVDPATVRFAGAPLRRVAGFSDVNGDGFADLLLQFDIPKLALARDATSAELTGQTTAGTMIRGTDAVTVVPRPKGMASQLVFSTQPSTVTAGAAVVPAVQVSARDAFGNPATSFTGPVTVAIATNPGGGTLAGTTTVGAVAGVATFANLAIDKAGMGYTLSAAATGLLGATSAAFTVAPAAATHLAFTVQPTNVTAGNTFTPVVRVNAQDAFGNMVTTFAGVVTMAITPGTGTSGAILSGTTAELPVGGVATFPNLNIDKAGTGYTLSATATGLTSAVSATFNIVAAAAQRLVFTIQPATTIAGAVITPAIQVSARDAFGNAATGFTGSVTIAIVTNPAGGVLTGTTVIAPVTGIAVFSDLGIDKAGSGYRLLATAAGVTPDTSAFFDIAASAAARLDFTVQPSTIVAGATMAPAVQVTAHDAFGNTLTGFTGAVALAIGTNGGSPFPGTLSGTNVVTAIAGVATFLNLSIDKAGSGYTLVATATGFTGATSAAFNVAPGAATRLFFSVQPGSVTAGTAFAPAVQVSAVDLFGNLDTNFTGNVAIAIASNPGGGVLSGTSIRAAAHGVTTFADLNIDRTGTGYTLAATAAGLTAATSVAFSVNAGTATRLQFSVQPSSTTAGNTITPAVRVSAVDQLGNLTSFTGNVTVAIGTNGGSPFPGTLSGTLTVAAAAGVATYPTLSIDKAGAGYTLAATAAGLTGATSAAFDITPGPAAQLLFTVQPTTTLVGNAITPAVQVNARDAFGNSATSFTGNVTIAIGVNPAGGTLSGTKTVAAVLGVATFATLSIDVAGSGYTLMAVSTELTAATSVAFDIVH